MGSNSNFNITKVVVDPTSQEITSLEINGKPIETGSEPNLQEKDLGFVGADITTIRADAGYDGLESVTFWTESEIFSRTINTRRYIGDAGLNFTMAQDLEHIWQYDATSGDWKALAFTKEIDSENELVTVTLTDSGYQFDWNVE